MKRIPSLVPAAVLALLVVLVSACDLTDINENPNNPLEVPPELMLAGVQSNFSYEIAGNTAVRIPSIWIQQLAYNGQPPNENTYDVTENDVNNLWEFWAYPDLLNNVRIMDSLATEQGSYAFAGIAKIMEAWTLSILTDLWGPIPYSEAFNVDDPTPGYDTQEEVYQAIFRLLDEAVVDLEKDAEVQPAVPSASSDLVYEGDLDRWIRLAHTLEGRFHMRLSEAPGYDQAEQARKAIAALEEGLAGNEDDADFQYYAGTGAENPWYQFAIDGKWNTATQISESYINLLKTLRDPRLAVQARQAGAIDGDGAVAAFEPVAFADSMYAIEDSTYLGVDPSSDGARTTYISSIGSYYSDAGAALNWLNYASALLTRAEAELITGGPAAAQPFYEAAIEAHMQKLGVTEEEIARYLDEREPLAADDARRRILTQKYIANFINVEAYNDWRRTGYPALEPVTFEDRSVDIIPLRFPYPYSELSRNAANVPEYVPGGYPAMTVPVWWDTTVPTGARPNPTQ